MQVKQVVIGVVVLAAAAGLIALRSFQSDDPNAPPIYKDTVEYQAALRQVQELTQGPFEAMHEDQPISDRERADLKKASRMIDGLIAFNGQLYAPYILKGMCRRALGDLDGAKVAYEQGLALAPGKPAGPDVAAIGRIYDELATLYYELHDYAKAEDNADLAAQMLPSEPSILTNAAMVKVQLKKTAEARKLLETALAIAPTYDRARGLKKFIEAAEPKR